MTRVLALADQSKIGSTPQRRFATAGTETTPQRRAPLDRNGLSVSPETACRFEPKSPVGNSEICTLRVPAAIEPVSVPRSGPPAHRSPRTIRRCTASSSRPELIRRPVRCEGSPRPHIPLPWILRGLVSSGAAPMLNVKAHARKNLKKSRERLCAPQIERPTFEARHGEVGWCAGGRHIESAIAG